MQLTIQLGKNGVTEGFIEALKNAFSTHESVKIPVLKSATRKREETGKIAGQICAILGKNYTSRIVGYTIFLKKWRKIPRSNRK